MRPLTTYLWGYSVQLEMAGSSNYASSPKAGGFVLLRKS